MICWWYNVFPHYILAWNDCSGTALRGVHMHTLPQALQGVFTSNSNKTNSTEKRLQARCVQKGEDRKKRVRLLLFLRFRMFYQKLHFFKKLDKFQKIRVRSIPLKVRCSFIFKAAVTQNVILTVFQIFCF